VESYTPGYSDVAVRYMSRRNAERDAAFLLPRLKPGITLLDCACGPGTITVGLAQKVAPGQVTAVDLEPSQIALAKQTAAAQGLTNLRFEAASVYKLPFPDQSFNAVYSHALFEHLSEPLTGLQELWRVLRPGGLVALSSPDWSGNLMAPRDAEAERAVEILKAIQKRNGGNPYVGREFGQLLAAAGFTRVELAAMYDCYEDPSLAVELMAGTIEDGVGRQIVEGPGLSRAEVGEICRAFRQWAKQPAVLFAQAFVEAVAYKEA
jgi:ubiquinone/menaquinone biosynthesis C-methylase UbiE